MIACENDHLAIARALTNAGADVNVKSVDNNNALFLAIYGNHTTLVKLLLSSGVTIECGKGIIRASSRYTISAHPMCFKSYACLTTKFLSPRLSPSAKVALLPMLPDDSTLKNRRPFFSYLGLVDSLSLSASLPCLLAGLHPLQQAIKQENYDIFDLLLNSGANLNYRVLETSGHVVFPLRCQLSALTYAIYKGSLVALKKLLEKSPALLSEPGNKCALVNAVCLSYDAIVEVLLDYGANIDEGNSAPPLWYACSNGFTSTTQLLLARGAQPDLGNYSHRHYNTPLMAACEEGHLDIVKILLEYNADLTLRINNQNCFEVAVRQNHLEIVEYLISIGVDINQPEPKLLATPLMIACAHKHHDMIKLLIQRGADYNAVDLNGKNARSFAEASETKAILEDCIYNIKKQHQAANNIQKLYRKYQRQPKPLTWIAARTIRGDLETLFKFQREHSEDFDVYKPILNQALGLPLS